MAVVEDLSVTLDVARGDTSQMTALLDTRAVEYKLRQIRAIDGESELTKIVIAGGSHAAVKLVDGLANLTGSLFSKIKGKGAPQPATKSLTDPDTAALCTFEIRRGDMKLSLENVPLDDVRRIIALLDENKPTE